MYVYISFIYVYMRWLHSVISRVSSRTLTYGGGGGGGASTARTMAKKSIIKPTQTRKIHVYGFYNEDGRQHVEKK
jgi:hypothetical protein